MNNITGRNAFDVAPLLFGWLDFSVFGTMLAASAFIGIYFGFCNKQETKEDYLLGGRSMKTFPVAISLVACHISGITVMGVPSEIYIYGIVYALVCFTCILVGFIMNYFYLPVFFDLQLTSTYEYLEMRFSRSVRVMASVLYTISMILYMPIVVYVPALAFSQVSGVGVHLITPVVCIICIFYTMVGGFKAVVWTDFIQTFVMVGSCVAVVILGVYKVGGLDTVIQTSYNGGRLNMLELDPNPTCRNTLWSVLIGTTIMWSATMVNQTTIQKILSLPTMSNVTTMDPSPLARNSFWTIVIGTTFLRTGSLVNQGSIQKFLSLPTMSKATQMLILYCIGIITMKVLSSLTGLIIYTAYHDCDPIRAKVVKRSDQLLAYFVMDTAGSIPGLPGLFVAGVFSASLSSMSSGLNCLAATIYEDFVRPFLKGSENERRDGYIMKTIVFTVGAISVLLVIVVEKLGGVLEITYSAQGITCGALLGLFSLGIFYPWANAHGALWGSIASLGLLSFIVLGAQNAIATGKLTHKTLPTSVEGCAFNFTTTTLPPISEMLVNEHEEAFILFRMSYWYYGVVGTFTVIIVGMVVSVLTGLQDPSAMNPALFAPFIRKYSEKRINENEDIVDLTEKDVLSSQQETK